MCHQQELKTVSEGRLSLRQHVLVNTFEALQPLQQKCEALGKVRMQAWQVLLLTASHSHCERAALVVAWLQELDMARRATTDAVEAADREKRDLLHR